MKLVLLFAAGTVLNMSTCNKKIESVNNSGKGLSKTEIMAGKVWQVDELIHNVGCNNSHYIRGVKNTTDVNYDNMQFTFGMDGQGTHTDQYGQVHPTSWKFDKKDDKTIYLTVHLSADINFTWRMVEANDAMIYGTTAVRVDGGDILESFRLRPVQ